MSALPPGLISPQAHTLHAKVEVVYRRPARDDAL
jgi:hypothetical protein